MTRRTFTLNVVFQTLARDIPTLGKEHCDVQVFDEHGSPVAVGSSTRMTRGQALSWAVGYAMDQITEGSLK